MRSGAKNIGLRSQEASVWFVNTQQLTYPVPLAVAIWLANTGWSRLVQVLMAVCTRRLCPNATSSVEIVRQQAPLGQDSALVTHSWILYFFQSSDVLLKQPWL